MTCLLYSSKRLLGLCGPKKFLQDGECNVMVMRNTDLTGTFWALTRARAKKRSNSVALLSMCSPT